MPKQMSEWAYLRLGERRAPPSWATQKSATAIASGGAFCPSPGNGITTDHPADVEMVMVEVAALAPGVTGLGENLQTLNDGRPEHARETSFPNGPNCDVEVTVVVTD